MMFIAIFGLLFMLVCGSALERAEQDDETAEPKFISISITDEC